MISGKIIRDVFGKAKGAEILPGLICRSLDEKHLPQINRLLASNYLKSPARQMFNISLEDNGDTDEKAAAKYLSSNMSLGVFEQRTDTLVSFAISTVHTREDGDPPHQITADMNRKVAAYLRFNNQLFGDVFTDLDTDCYTRGRYICTNPEYRSKGLSAVLGQIGFEGARAKGCEYAVTLINSYYLQKAARAIGYKVLRELKFADYVDPDTGLKPDLQLSDIHKSAQLVYVKIPPRI